MRDTQEQRKALEHDTDSHSGVSMGDADRIFEASEREHEPVVDILPYSISCPTKVGPNLGTHLANMINSDLVGHDDLSQLKEIHEKYIRPENIPNLVVPKMNEKLSPSDTVLLRESGLCNLQQNITTAITVVSALAHAPREPRKSCANADRALMRSLQKHHNYVI